MNHEIPVLDKSGLRRFGLMTGAIVAVLFGIGFPTIFDKSWPVWPWVIFLILGAWALVAPGTLNPVYRGWMRFGIVLSKITTPIILTLLFFVVIFPASLIVNLFRKDPLHRKFDSTPSYRINSKQPSVKNLERPY